MICLGDTKVGWQLDIDDDCGVVEDVGACSNFESSTDFFGTYVNVTKNLRANSKCTITVDATSAPARLILDGSSNLGVLYPGYVIGEPITIPEGFIRYVTIYNGNQAGILRYTLSFSAAKALVTSGAAAIAMAFALLV